MFDSSWTKNTDLEELDHSTVAELVTAKMRKDLQEAHLLAEKNQSLEHYQQVLRDYEEARLEMEEAKAAKAKAKDKKGRKSEPVAPVDDEEEDVEMADAEEGDDSEVKKQKSKKRKAEEDSNVSAIHNHISYSQHDTDSCFQTPQRSNSVKKPKIKLTTSSTPKTGANGVQSPKVGKESATKSVKVKASKPSKASKDADAKKEEKEAVAAKEPELTAEERLERKQVSREPPRDPLR